MTTRPWCDECLQSKSVKPLHAVNNLKSFHTFPRLGSLHSHTGLLITNVCLHVKNKLSIPKLSTRNYRQINSASGEWMFKIVRRTYLSVPFPCKASVSGHLASTPQSIILGRPEGKKNFSTQKRLAAIRSVWALS